MNFLLVLDRHKLYVRGNQGIKTLGGKCNEGGGGGAVLNSFKAKRKSRSRKNIRGKRKMVA